MELTNATDFAAAYTVGLRPDGRELLVVVAKASFTLPLDGSEPRLLEEQVAATEADAFAGEPALSAPLYETDYAPVKPRCDVLLNGSAYAPDGKPAKRVAVALEVGPVRKAFQVVGQRVWKKQLLAVNASGPAPFTVMPISYGNAFGGRDLTHKDPKKHRYYPTNHVGVGFHVNVAKEHVNDRPLPNTEESGKKVTRPDGKYRPMAFGPIGRAWEQRARLAGTYDASWLADVCPFLPSDFQEAYYQAAPVEQQMPYPQGGEEVKLLNLTPTGRTAFRIPRLEIPIQFFLRDDEPEELAPVLDTLLIEPDLGRFSLTFRTSRPLKRDIFEVEEIVVGRMSSSFYRAREVGKTYCKSLAEAVALWRIELTGEEELEEEDVPTSELEAEEQAEEAIDDDELAEDEESEEEGEEEESDAETEEEGEEEESDAETRDVTEEKAGEEGGRKT